MKKSVAFAMFMAMVMFGVPANAQMMRSNVLGDLHTLLNRQQGGFRSELLSDRLSLRDAATGSEICAVTQSNPQSMMLVGEVVKLDKSSADVVSRVMQKMAYYNFNSLVGTLVYDSRSGLLRMEHHLNPQLTSVESIAAVVSMFESSVRAESQRFSQLTEGNLGIR